MVHAAQQNVEVESTKERSCRGGEGEPQRVATSGVRRRRTMTTMECRQRRRRRRSRSSLLFCIVLGLSVVSCIRRIRAENSSTEVIRTDDDGGGTHHQRSWDYFDQIRQGEEYQSRSMVHEGSRVITVLEEGTTEKKSPSSFRLCHLFAFYPLTLSSATSREVLTPDEPSRYPRPGAYNRTWAALMAIHHFNNRMDTIVPQLGQINDCDIRLTADILDTEYSASAAIGKYMGGISDHPHTLSTPHPLAIAGVARSSIAGPMAEIAAAQSTVVVSHSATSAGLDNKDRFPTFGRTVPSVRGDAGSFVDYLEHVLGASHFGVIYVRDSYGSSYVSALEQSVAGASQKLQRDDPDSMGMKMKSIPIDFSQSTGDGQDREIARAVGQLKQTGYRYFFAVLFEKNFVPVLEEAARQGIVGDDYLWMFGDGISSAFMSELSLPFRSPLRMSHLTGMGLLRFKGGISGMKERPGYERLLQAWHSMENETDVVKEYARSKHPTHELDPNVTFAFDVSPIGHVPFVYDAIISLGLAACRIPKTSFDGRELYDALKGVDFDGASGRVKFDAETGTRDYLTVLYTMSNVVVEDGRRASVSVTGVYGGSDGWTKLHPYRYADGTNQAPTNLPPYVENTNHIPRSILASGLLLSAIAMVLSILCTSWTVFHRQKRTVRASQPEFLCMLCAGTFIMALSVVPASLQEPLVDHRGLDRACMAIPWLFCLGFVVSFSTLLAKMLRLNKVFGNGQFQKTSAVLAKDVVYPLVSLLTVNVLLLTLWTALSPLKYKRINYVAMDEFGRSVESYATCEMGEQSSIFFGLLLVTNLGCLALANYQAFRARKITTHFGESRYIFCSMASILQASCFIIPVFLALERPWSQFLVFSAFVLLICVAILGPMFVPKMSRQRVESRRRRTLGIVSKGWHSSVRVIRASHTSSVHSGVHARSRGMRHVSLEATLQARHELRRRSSNISVSSVEFLRPPDGYTEDPPEHVALKKEILGERKKWDNLMAQRCALEMELEQVKHMEEEMELEQVKDKEMLSDESGRTLDSDAEQMHHQHPQEDLQVHGEEGGTTPSDGPTRNKDRRNTIDSLDIVVSCDGVPLETRSCDDGDPPEG